MTKQLEDIESQVREAVADAVDLDIDRTMIEVMLTEIASDVRHGRQVRKSDE